MITRSIDHQMLNFDFKRSSKKCSKTARILLPGEEFYSALVEREGNTDRLDFCLEAWEGPPEDCLGWWKSRIPDVGKGKIYWAPRHVLLSFFEHVANQPSQSDVAYITALLLTQKKILALDDTLDEPDSQILQLKNRQDNQVYQIPVIEVPPQRLIEIQDELAERLFMDQPYDPESDEVEDGESN